MARTSTRQLAKDWLIADVQYIRSEKQKDVAELLYLARLLRDTKHLPRSIPERLEKIAWQIRTGQHYTEPLT